MEELVEGLVGRYRDKTLNDLAEFDGLNPSIEHFCRIVANSFSDGLNAANISAVTARIWENEIAWVLLPGGAQSWATDHQAGLTIVLNSKLGEF